MNEAQQNVDQAQAAIELIEKRIANALQRKDDATRRGERAEYDKAQADLQFDGDRLKLAELDYQRVRAELDASERAEKIAELEEERSAANRETAQAAIRELIVDAASRILEFRGIRAHALEIAEMARGHAQRANELARELGIISITASVDETEIERAFARMLKEESES